MTSIALEAEVILVFEQGTQRKYSLFEPTDDTLQRLEFLAPGTQINEVTLFDFDRQGKRTNVTNRGQWKFEHKHRTDNRKTVVILVLSKE